MCGRYALSADVRDIYLQFSVDGKSEAVLPANWNISPTNKIYFVKALDHEGSERKIEIGSWGLVPSWSKDTTRATASINARVETIAEKPTFRSAFRSRRCLVPANGYYEWATQAGKFKPKQPFYISYHQQTLLPMAGIYEEWVNPKSGEIHTSVSIITRDSTGEIAKIHNRMPVILPQDRWSHWLSTDSLNKNQINEYLDLLDVPNPDENLVAVAVSTAVNNSRNYGSGLIKEVALEDSGTIY